MSSKYGNVHDVNTMLILYPTYSMERREIADIIHDFTGTLNLNNERPTLSVFEGKLDAIQENKTADDRHTIALLKAYIKLRKDLAKIVDAPSVYPYCSIVLNRFLYCSPLWGDKIY